MSWERRVAIGAVAGAAALGALIAAGEEPGKGPLSDLELTPETSTTVQSAPLSPVTTFVPVISTTGTTIKVSTTTQRRTTSTKRPEPSTTTTLLRLPGGTVGGPSPTTSEPPTTAAPNDPSPNGASGE